MALLFRRAAEAEITEEVLVREASLDLHWFSPKDARRVLEAARALGYLVEGTKPALLRPGFDLEGVEVPIDFKIDARALQATSAGVSPVSDELVEKAAAARGVSPEVIWREVEARQARVLVEAPVAAALVAADAGVDVRPFARRIAEELAGAARATSSAS